MKSTYWEISKSVRLSRTNGVWEPADFRAGSGRNDEDGAGFRASNLDPSLPDAEPDVLMCNDLPRPSVSEAKALAESLDPVFEKYGCLTSQVAFSHRDKRFWVRNGKRLVSEQRDHYAFLASGTLKDSSGRLRSFYLSMTPTNDWSLVPALFPEALEREIRETAAPAKAPALSGEMDVVVAGDSGGGVLFHEAIGHGLEQDIYPDGAFDRHEGKEGVFPENVEVWDDPTFEFANGSYGFDHEGNAGKPVALVKDGKINETMKSRLVGGAKSNGHGRRENWSCSPLVRMSVTYLANGDRDPKDVIASVKDGLYVEKIGGGQVNVRSGEFVFQASRARLIKDGKLGARVAEISLKGTGVQVLKDISMIGDDLDLSPEALAFNGGTCGKGQRMPTSEACPTFRTKIFVSA